MDLIDPGASSFGTKAALWLLFGATLPSFLSANDVKSFHIPAATISQSFYLRFTAAPFRLLSPPYTVITSAFHHSAVSHFAGNAYGLFWNGIVLDAGFLATTFIFVVGALAGSGAMILERTFVAREVTLPDPLRNWLPAALETRLVDFLKPLGPVYQVCGSSGAVFALMGATVSETIDRIGQTSKKRTRERTQLLTSLYFRLLNVGLQVYALVFGPPVSVVWDEPGIGKVGSEIGHAAHVGGFAAGFLVWEVYRWFR